MPDVSILSDRPGPTCTARLEHGIQYQLANPLDHSLGPLDRVFPSRTSRRRGEQRNRLVFFLPSYRRGLRVVAVNKEIGSSSSSPLPFAVFASLQ
jgi:hypothetical protein